MKFKYRFELKWALIFTATTLAWMIFEKLMGWHGPKIHQHGMMTNFFAIPATLVYVLALREARTVQFKGKMTWKQGFVAGLKISAIVAVLAPLNQWVISTKLSPEYFPNIIEYAVKNENQDRQAMEAYFNVKAYMIQSFIGAIVMGAMTSAVVSIFLRPRKK